VLSKSQTLFHLINNLPKYPGQSYLLNYIGLRDNYRLYIEKDVINYIVLAAYRDYKYSVQFDDYSLDWKTISFSEKQIDINKLLWHKDGKIFFLFEEDKASTLRKRNKNGN
jgi:hypothetical protein